VTYSVRLTGPVEHPLAPGRYELVQPGFSIHLSLFRVARDARHIHYEAYLGEAL
jgi:hypothetical protein